MVNNYDVARAFVSGRRASGSNFMTDGTTLYSYNTAIAKRMPNGEIIINNTKYSRTTSKHLGYLKRSIPAGSNVSYTGGKGYNYEFRDFENDNDDVFKKHLRK